MSGRSFKEHFDDARRHPEYWRELAILEFTDELVRVMDESGVSRAELARRLQTSPAYVTKALRGDANLTISSMAKLARALDLELRVHLAPAGALTTWRDTLPGNASADSGDAPGPVDGRSALEEPRGAAL